MFPTTIYDDEGREKTGGSPSPCVIGYFTSLAQETTLKRLTWVNYLVKQLTHINYAFVGIGSDGKK